MAEALGTILRGMSSTWVVQGHARFPPGSVYRTATSLWELLLLEEGGMRWRLGGRQLAVPEGSICLVRGGLAEERRWEPRRPSRHGVVEFRLSETARRVLEELDPPLLRPPEQAGAMPALFRRLLARLARPDFSQELALQELRLLAAYYLSGGGSEVVDPWSRLGSVVREALQQLQRDWVRRGVRLLPLRDWALLVGVSPEHLCRLFRRELDCTPQQAQQLLRAHHARHLLSQTRLSSRAIARRLGFPDSSHLARALRRHYGLPPQELRKRMHSTEPALDSAPGRLGEFAGLFWR